MGSNDCLKIDPENLKLIAPFTLVCAGPSQSGKSHFIFSLLDNLDCINTKFEKIIFIYGVWQSLYKNYPNIFFTDKIDYLNARSTGPVLIICDDVMTKIGNSKPLEDLFTRGRHAGVSTILILQSLFYQGSVMKTIRNNSTYIAVTAHLQDIMRLSTFATQLERKNSSYFFDSYENIMQEKFAYLFCDLHPKSILRDAPYFIKYRSKVHSPRGQVLYIDRKRYTSNL